ncbi:MAG: 2-oxo acid dehydrogenase subunit E2, partial [Candidatus Aenigmarchaeota archaeon]|nr:2-oxo acid dehydrogenase subunit E2 [Candidatus Aenigmarchaeota archaeon]
KKYYNIGIAVDIEGGLVVPVIKRAETQDIFQVAKNIQELAEKARTRTLDMMDLKGGTFTITNIGIIGGTHATPIINYPEVAILATGQIREKPVVRDNRIVIRKILPLSLSFDHRVLDGAEAARFVTDLIKLLESPREIRLEGEQGF